LSCGYLVPSSDFSIDGEVSGQHVWYMENCINSESGVDKLQADLEQFRKSYPLLEGIIISAENLFEHPKAPSLFEKIHDHFDIKVVGHIRRQDEYIESSWQQWFSKIHEDFISWVFEVSGLRGNWAQALKRWESVIPRSNITLSIYERSQLIENDVVKDFVNMSQLDRLPLDYKFSQQESNSSFSHFITDLVSGNRSIFNNVHDNAFYRFIREQTGEKYRKKKGESILTADQREALLRRYESGNNWIKNHYFPHQERLFSPIDKSRYAIESEEDNMRKQLKFLTELVYKNIKPNSK